MAPGPPSIFGTLSASPRARAVATLDLGSGRSAALWRNSFDRVSYAGAEGHTLSLYVEGGAGTRRVDGRQAERRRGGHPGALCVMPQGAPSEWEIGAPFAFVHLHLPAAELRRAYAETFDRDARLLEVPELTFAEAPGVAPALRALAAATRAGAPLAAEAAAAEAVARFLADPRVAGGSAGRRAAGTVTGGLAPHLRRRLLDHVEAHLGERLRLRELAAVAGLSEAHLQRAFAATQGVSPQSWIAHRRVERARALLRGREPIAAIALACGFSGQSHLTRAFKGATGVTPGAYRAAV